MARPLSITLRVVRVLAALTILFGIGAAGNSFPSQRTAKGIDAGVFGNGVLALLGLKDPLDGEMFPVWVGRVCVVVGAALMIGITVLLDRDRKRGTTPPPARTPLPPPPPGGRREP